ncbi:hypothetical protein [Anderseniella sp. Alg231-50]|uniref:hypothetical protein n=1 Tax=Anderseniella sp. Alg231-50 TaxID=1922226 RepID=UPI000D55BBF0
MDSASDNFKLIGEALAEAQQTVRAYDTKAQIVGVGYIFALRVVFGLGELLPQAERSDILLVVVGWTIVILPILLFGFVLYPTRKSAAELASLDGRSRGLLYFSPGRHASIKSYLDELGQADATVERTRELFIVTELRELKRKRFLRALFAAGLAFIVLFGGQLWRGVVAA